MSFSELLSKNIAFCEQRIREQDSYIKRIYNRDELPIHRQDELTRSAFTQQEYFINKLNQYQSLKSHDDVVPTGVCINTLNLFFEMYPDIVKTIFIIQ